MLQCKYIETMSQQDKTDLLNALIVTKGGYESKEKLFTYNGLCSNVYINSINSKPELIKILLELFGKSQHPFNLSTQDYWEEEDKSKNPKRMKFLHDLIDALEASIEQMRWR